MFKEAMFVSMMRFFIEMLNMSIEFIHILTAAIYPELRKLHIILFQSFSPLMWTTIFLLINLMLTKWSIVPVST